jgi:hypothetical protein
MKADPFAAYRQSTSTYSAITGSDGRSLTLSGIGDAAAIPAEQVIEIANRHAWHVRVHRHLHTVTSLEVRPRR